jgi:hypothetical protein
MPGVGSGGVAPLTQKNGLQLISSSLRLVGALLSGGVPREDEARDCLSVLNDMLDAWSSERLSIFCVLPITKDANNNPLALTAGQQAYRLGNAVGNEDWLLPRPPRIDRVSVMYSASQQTPIEVALDPLDDVGWQAVANKSTTSILPQAYFDDKNYPDRTLYFWPVPTQANPVVLYAWAALAGFKDLNTYYSFPPGYAEAIRYNLAVRLAAEFPADLQKIQIVMKIAAQAKARIMGFNAPIKEASVGDELRQHGGYGNIYTGLPTRGSRN